MKRAVQPPGLTPSLQKIGTGLVLFSWIGRVGEGECGNSCYTVLGFTVIVESLSGFTAKVAGSNIIP